MHFWRSNSTLDSLSIVFSGMYLGGNCPWVLLETPFKRRKELLVWNFYFLTAHLTRYLCWKSRAPVNRKQACIRLHFAQKAFCCLCLSFQPQELARRLDIKQEVQILPGGLAYLNSDGYDASQKRKGEYKLKENIEWLRHYLTPEGDNTPTQYWGSCFFIRIFLYAQP